MNCSDTDLACHSMETDIPPDDLCTENPDVCVAASQPEESLSMMDVQLDEPIFIGLPSNLDVGTYDSLNGIQQILDTCTPKNETMRYIQKSMGRGSYGVTYSICVNQNDPSTCSAVAKVVHVARNETKERVRTLEEMDFRMECAIANHASEQGYGPKIRNMFMCRGPGGVYGVLIMERLYRTAFEMKKELTESDCRAMARVMNLMHNAGVWHTDLHLSNIMQRADQSFCIIDFGNAWPLFTSVPPLLRMVDFESWIHDLGRAPLQRFLETEVAEGLYGSTYRELSAQAYKMRKLDKDQFKQWQQEYTETWQRTCGPMASVSMYLYAAKVVSIEALRKLGSVVFAKRTIYYKCDYSYRNQPSQLMILERLEKRRTEAR